MSDVVTVGTATRDVFLTSKYFKVLKDPTHLKKIGILTDEAECFALGGKIATDRPVYASGGGAVNAAVTFARLGFDTRACFRVGGDEAGEAVVKDVKGEGVAVSVSFDDKSGTGYSVILLGGDGERTILTYRGASSGLKADDAPVRSKVKCVYIAPGEIPFAVIKQLVDYFDKQGAVIAINPSRYYVEMGRAKLAPLLGKIDVVILNREEGALLTGADYEKEKDVFRKFDELVTGVAVMTDGPRGATASDGRYFYRAGVFKEKALADRTGAGDGFGAGFTAGFLQTNDIGYGLRLGAANSTMVVERIGAHTGAITQKEFQSLRWNYLDMDVEPL